MKFTTKPWVVPPFLVTEGAARLSVGSSAGSRRHVAGSIARADPEEFAEAVPRDDLPGPIASFVRRAAPSRQRAPVAIRIRQRGEMRFSPQGKWQALTAVQVVAVHEPGFVWRASCRMAPLMTAQVIDSYVRGEGRLEARLFRWVQVAHADGPETAKSELMRYLAELPWAPDAIRYNRLLRWRSVDDRTFEVSADSVGGEARVRLMLDEQGDIVGMRADDRPRIERGKAVPGKWFGVFSDYQELSGYRIPARGEVGWDLKAGQFVYWRGEIVAFEVG